MHRALQSLIPLAKKHGVALCAVRPVAMATINAARAAAGNNFRRPFTL